MRVNFTATQHNAGEQEAEFDEWYTYEHVSDICRGEGFHRGWRMVRDSAGPFQKYWGFYESDSPEDLVNSRKGKAPWGGLWGDVVDQESFCRSYHRVLEAYRRV